MRTIITTATLVLALATAACGDKDGNSCSKVVDHTLSLMPAELQSQLGDKKALIEKCEKEMTAEQRTCALGAKSMEDLMKCPR